jgi:DNA polymerase I-like protein with 3'-5' exonuclease and polymerase domains
VPRTRVLTLRIFYLYVPQLFDEGLESFFYDEESMPLMRGPTYQLNTVGLRVDMAKLKQLENDLTQECGRLRAEIQEAVTKYASDRYPGTSKKTTFNIGSATQLAWLLFIKLGNEFKFLTDGGRAIAKELCGRIPYNASAKRQFILSVQTQRRMATEKLSLAEAQLKEELAVAEGKEAKDAIRAKYKPRLSSLRKEVTKWTPEKYIACDKDTLTGLAKKYDWVAKLLNYRGSGKLLSTYVLGIQSRARYGVINPGFLQHGTTSGRYSSNNPNFQNLPRDDKRVKACIVSRPGKSFIGADYSQLEPRVFASVSQDEALMACFARGEDFYSVVGIPVFKKFECSTYKKAENSFDKLYPHLRQNSKTLSLASAYGTTANQQASKLRDEEGNNLTVAEAQELIDAYFEAYPAVKRMMTRYHEEAMSRGVVYNLFGRPRRIPEATRIRKIYGKKAKHETLPYEARTLLNLAMNHPVQSTGASIVNRAAIAFLDRCAELALEDPRWREVRLVLQVHDELVAEGPDELAEAVARELKIRDGEDGRPPRCPARSGAQDREMLGRS